MQAYCADLGKKQHYWRIGPSPGRTKAKQGPQQHSQVEPGKVDNVAFLHIGCTANMHAPHSAPVKTMGKTALHLLAPGPQKRLART